MIINAKREGSRTLEKIVRMAAGAAFLSDRGLGAGDFRAEFDNIGFQIDNT